MAEGVVKSAINSCIGILNGILEGLNLSKSISLVNIESIISFDINLGFGGANRKKQAAIDEMQAISRLKDAVDPFLKKIDENEYAVYDGDNKMLFEDSLDALLEKEYGKVDNLLEGSVNAVRALIMKDDKVAALFSKEKDKVLALMDRLSEIQEEVAKEFDTQGMAAEKDYKYYCAFAYCTFKVLLEIAGCE